MLLKCPRATFPRDPGDALLKSNVCVVGGALPGGPSPDVPSSSPPRSPPCPYSLGAQPCSVLGWPWQTPGPRVGLILMEPIGGLGGGGGQRLSHTGT